MLKGLMTNRGGILILVALFSVACGVLGIFQETRHVFQETQLVVNQIESDVANVDKHELGKPQSSHESKQQQQQPCMNNDSAQQSHDSADLARAEKMFSLAQSWMKKSPFNSNTTLFDGLMGPIIAKGINTTHGNRGWTRLVQKAVSGREILVMVVGGSNSAGSICHGCYEDIVVKSTSRPRPRNRRVHVYASIVATFFEYIGANVSYINLARGGWNSCTMAPGFKSTLASRAVDLAMIEFAVNDIVINNSPGCFETIVRTVLESSPNAAVVSVEILIPTLEPKVSQIARVHNAITHHYRISTLTISTNDFIGESKKFWNRSQMVHCLRANLLQKLQLVCNQAHLSNWGHQLLADRLASHITGEFGSLILPPTHTVNKSIESSYSYYLGNAGNGKVYWISRMFNKTCFLDDGQTNINPVYVAMGLVKLNPHPPDPSICKRLFAHYGTKFLNPFEMMELARKRKSVESYRKAKCGSPDRPKDMDCNYVPFAPSKIIGPWEYYGEGSYLTKTGWIVHGQNHEVSFDVPLDSHPLGYVIKLGFLRSYEKMNTLTVIVTDVHDSSKITKTELDGLWKKKVSLPEVVQVHVAFGACVVRIISGNRKAPNNKVKIVLLGAQKLL